MRRLWLLLALPALLLAVSAAGDAGPLGLATVLATSVAVALVGSAAALCSARRFAPARLLRARQRQRARRALVLRLFDPDAEGRTRPRAPSLGSADTA